MIDGCYCIVGHKVGFHTKRALLYLVSGGKRSYQMLKVSTMVRYINETDRDLRILFYPFYKEKTFPTPKILRFVIE